MKKKIITYTMMALCALIWLTACSKDDGKSGKPPGEEPQDVDYLEYAHGEPVGQEVSKRIGPAGGTLAMPDGKISIQIPEGAMHTATEITIQPVTNTLPMGSGAVNYKITPENVQFSKPVTIQFKYDEADLDGTIPDAMYVAFQNDKGQWFGKVNTAIEHTSKTLTVKTKHFSTWGKYQLFRLASQHQSLQAGESTELTVFLSDTQDHIADSPDDLIAPLLDPKKYNARKNFSGWKIYGKGKLKVDANNIGAQYTAPASIDKKSIATAEVTISNLFDKVEPDRPGKSGKMILQKSIELAPLMFGLTVDGKEIALTNLFAGSNGTNMVISGNNGNKEVQITINAVGKGQYAFQINGGTIAANKSVIYYDHTDGIKYLCSTYKCPETGNSGMIISPGTVNITAWGEKGAVISGNFETELYAPNTDAPIPCRSPKTIKVKAEFAIKRVD